MVSFLRQIWNTAAVRRRHPELNEARVIRLDALNKIRDEEFLRSGMSDVLTPVLFRKGTNGYHGSHHELKSVFAGVELGTWAIDEKTMDWFWDTLDQVNPSVILEFGSGCSTCLFAAWMRLRNPRGVVVSVDQNEWAAEQTCNWLRRVGLDGFVKVLVMPLDRYDNYIVKVADIKNLLGGRTVDVVFSDGPAGRRGCRENTLPSVFGVLSSSAHWYLHDALRDGELEILRKWESQPGVSVNGVLPFGNGLAIGTFDAR